MNEPVGYRAARLRTRLGLWLIWPWLRHRTTVALNHADNGDKPPSYHKDWWWGQYFALEHLRRDLVRGYPTHDIDEGARR